LDWIAWACSAKAQSQGQVTISKHSDRSIALDHDNRADSFLFHQAGSLGQGLGRIDSDRLAGEKRP
jgi:hypothetical protein